jgi:hypothetical protein
MTPPAINIEAANTATRGTINQERSNMEIL